MQLLLPEDEFQRIILENNAFWLNTLDNDAKVTSWNKAAEEISGYHVDEVLGNGDIWALLYPDEEYRNYILQKAFEIINEENRLIDFETIITTKEGEKKTLSWNTHNIKDPQGEVIGSMAIAKDITQIKEHEKQLERLTKELEASNAQLHQLSYTDTLTNIPNRRAFDEKMSDTIHSHESYHQELSLLMIDIDHFKEYNDFYGHIQGDTVLCDVSKAIQASLSRKTDFMARYGGEEIVVILPSTPLEDAKIISKRILQAIIDLDIEHQTSECEKVLTVSIGVASSSSKLLDLLELADQALYQAKEKGRNRYEVYVS
jgi:diguanylate cyclase (GGDEF)-like protein/PAS domain S-box-containing protein